MAPLGLLIAPAMCGIHLCLLRRERDLPIRFEMLFDGFNYFVQSLIATLIITAPTVLLAIAAYFATYAVMFGVLILTLPPPRAGQAPPSPEVGIVLLSVGSVVLLGCITVLIVISIFTIFVYPLIVDKELPGFQAVKLSCKAAYANLGGIIGLLILELLIELAAACVCCIGPILIAPLNVAIVAIAYRQVFVDDDPFADFHTESPPDDDSPNRLPAPSESITAIPGERPA